ncbi:MAG: hypothetical protein WCK51_07885 [Armatimonadota bacterium]
MRILLDQCFPNGVSRYVFGHECVRSKDMGWNLLVDGELLEAAEQHGFQVLLTIDKGIPHQQNLSTRNIAVIVMAPIPPTVPQLVKQVPELLALLLKVEPGKAYFVS